MTADYNPTEAQRLIEWARIAGISGGSILALADQLEAAGREVERLKLDAAAAEHGGLVAIEHYGVLFTERDSLRQQLEVAHRERGIAFAEREHANDWMARIKPEYEKLQTDLAAAQRRIAELEDNLGSQTSNLDIIMRSAEFRKQRISELMTDRDGLLAALRAIWPVYRAAAEHVNGMRRSARESAIGTLGRLVDLVFAARPSITPDILAALELL